MERRTALRLLEGAGENRFAAGTGNTPTRNIEVEQPATRSGGRNHEADEKKGIIDTRITTSSAASRQTVPGPPRAAAPAHHTVAASELRSVNTQNAARNCFYRSFR
jgi:hypothetical protein